MSKPILLSASQLRIDGRRALEIRPLASSFQQQQSGVDGSASLSQGLTSVRATVHGPRDGARYATTRPPAHAASLSVDVHFAPFSASDRRKRSKTDKRVAELQIALKNTFEPAIMLDLYPRSTIDVSLLILNQDGSLLSTAINAVTLALIHAGIALSSPVSAITLSVLHDTALLDPCSPEENELPSLTVACMAPLGGQDIGKLTLVSLDSRLTMDRFEALLRLATKACAVIGKEIEDVSKDFAQSALHALGGASAREGRAIVMHADDDEDAMVDG